MEKNETAQKASTNRVDPREFFRNAEPDNLLIDITERMLREFDRSLTIRDTISKSAINLARLGDQVVGAEDPNQF
jgi:hypothetical protein